MKLTILRNVGPALLFAGLTFALPTYAEMHGGTDAMGMGNKPATAMTDNGHDRQRKTNADGQDAGDHAADA